MAVLRQVVQVGTSTRLVACIHMFIPKFQNIHNVLHPSFHHTTSGSTSRPRLSPLVALAKARIM